MSSEPPEEKPPSQPVIDHVGLEVSDLDRSIAFYEAVFAPLGVREIFRSSGAVAYGKHSPVLWIVARGRGASTGFGHLAISAAGRRAVDAAYDAGIAHGGSDDGAPGLRLHYGPSYYAAYLLDPDGYRIEFVSGSH